MERGAHFVEPSFCPIGGLGKGEGKKKKLFAT